MTPSDVLRGALELLPDEEAWSHDGWGASLHEQGPVCIANAMSTAVVRLAAPVGVFRTAQSFVAEECGIDNTVDAVGRWNDDPHTTFLDVRLVLKRALARAEESDELS